MPKVCSLEQRRHSPPGSPTPMEGPISTTQLPLPRNCFLHQEKHFALNITQRGRFVSLNFQTPLWSELVPLLSYRAFQEQIYEGYIWGIWGTVSYTVPCSLCAASVHQRTGIQDPQTTLERPKPTKGPCAHYHPPAWFLQDLLGFSRPRRSVFRSQETQQNQVQSQ